MLDLLKRPEYVTLNQDQNIQAILERMGLVDEEFLSVERVEQHKAADTLKGNELGLAEISSSMETAGGVGDTQNDPEVWNARDDARAVPQLVEGVNFEAIGYADPPWANHLNPKYDYGNVLGITTDAARRRGADAVVHKPQKSLKKQLLGTPLPMSQMSKTTEEYKEILRSKPKPQNSKPKTPAVSKASAAAKSPSAPSRTAAAKSPSAVKVPAVAKSHAAARGGLEEEGMGSESDASDGDGMSDHGGGRSRSRKRSASKRTRRRKATTKKQKSKKNKRQSRRKVRRSSSRRSLK
jgi:hypothetical protein